MATSSGIRAGKTYVEVSSDDNQLVRGLRQTERRLKAFGASVSAIGAKLAGLGSAIAAPLTVSSRAFANYESALASLRANANPTVEELEAIEAAVMRISRATGNGPAAVTAAMTELLKAGLPLEAVLGGAAKAALEFAKVAEMDAAEAAEVLTDAMNVFEADAPRAVDAISKAADASSISVRDVAMAFSMAGAVAANAGLSIEETANALAILGQNGVKGSDAGTSLKTALLRLQTGAESAGETMKKLGINVRNADGSMMDMRSIIGALQAGLAGLSSEARDTALLKLFGTDAIRAGAILLKEGVDGWDRFSAAMESSLSVSDKFAIVMATLNGDLSKLWASIERLAVAIGGSLGPIITRATTIAVGLIDGLAAWASNNQGLVATIATVAAAVGGAGVALIGLGVAVQLVSVAAGGLATILGVVLSPVGLITTALVVGTVAWMRYTESGQAAASSLKTAFSALAESAKASFTGIANALKAGDIGLAAKILWLSLQVQWQKGVNTLNAIWQDWGTAAKTVVSDFEFWLARSFTDAWAKAKTIVAQASGWIGNIWDSLISGIQRGWTTMISELSASIASFEGLFSTVLITLGMHRANEQFKEAIAKVREMADSMQSETDDRLAARAGEMQQKIAQIEADQAAAQASLDDQQAAADEDRFAAARESIKAGDAELAKLQAELQAAIAEAADAAAPSVSVDAGIDAAGKGARGPLSGVGTLDQISRKVDVAGSFDASAFRGLGVGSSVADRQLDEARKQTDLLQSLDDRAREGGLAFS